MKSYKPRSTKSLLIWLLLACALTACAFRPSEREMNYLASALTKLSSAVDASVRFRPLSATVSEGELLQAATAHDPGLLKPFAQYTLRVQRTGRASAVLVCDQSGTRALLEDAGCTAKMDEHRWSAPRAQACQFNLDLGTMCAE